MTTMYTVEVYMTHTYTIWTDASSMDVDAPSFDAAVAAFARAEQINADNWDELVEHVRGVGNGAWVRADSDTDPHCSHLFYDSSDDGGDHE